MWVLLVLSTYGGPMPDNAALQEFSSKATCESARSWVVSHQNPHKDEKLASICLPK